MVAYKHRTDLYVLSHDSSQLLQTSYSLVTLRLSNSTNLIKSFACF